MAPRVIRKKAAARTRPSSTTNASTGRVTAPREDPFSTFSTTKKDKRRLKHSALVTRIEKANAKTGKKRRRPSNKLVTTLESLVDALPEAKSGDDGKDAIEGARITHASLKSRPGALKRKEKIESLERERFARNMAQMAQGASTKSAPGSGAGVAAHTTNDTSVRWAALRGHIQSAMGTMGADKGK